MKTQVENPHIADVAVSGENPHIANVTVSWGKPTYR